jgi:uncharacterized protein involved in type VI secretion and phage assembly
MAKITDTQGKPHSGIVPFTVVALVTDNVDPDELGRLKVKFPTLHEEPLSFWLRQVSPNAGKERGLYALPEKEDEVLVVFLQGSQDVGIIIGQFWNGIDKPPPEAKDKMPKAGDQDTGAEWSTDKYTEGSKDLSKNDRRFWKSRSGALMVFDDTSGKESVHLWDKDKNLSMVFDSSTKRIILANKEGDLHIRTKKNLFLEAGETVKIKAKQDIVAEAGAKMTLKSTAQTDVTSSGPVNVKGTPIKMN